MQGASPLAVAFEGAWRRTDVGQAEATAEEEERESVRASSDAKNTGVYESLPARKTCTR